MNEAWREIEAKAKAAGYTDEDLNRGVSRDEARLMEGTNQANDPTRGRLNSVTTPIEDIGPPPWFGKRVPKPARTIPPMPQRADLVEGQLLVVPVSEPDEFNRVSFFAYWLDSATPDGVRGQRFHTQLERFSADRNVKVQCASST